ncbi:MAG: ABC transporter substrate-binding protein [Betaproteobacteria bacterium]|nr:ABC transporter substrate-binding protein [Betaproteobacteria bacterium]
MKRREFVLSMAGALAVPLASSAQKSQAKIARIGFLGLPSAPGWTPMVEALRAGLREFGYVEGRNIAIEFRWAEGNYDRLPGLAAELVRLKVDLIVTHTTLGTRVAKQATTSIPIVIAATGDAVEAGLVASFARPGGNVTGSSFLAPEIAAKRLDLLKEALPRIRRIAVLRNVISSTPLMFEAVARAAKSLRVELYEAAVQGPDEIESAFARMANWRADGVVIVEDPVLVSKAKEIAQLAVKRRLPTIGYVQIAEAGGLMGFGASIAEMHRHAAYFIDKILKGAKPGDLPIEQPTRFELLINLKTAKALGLTIPRSLLIRADRMIE